MNIFFLLPFKIDNLKNIKFYYMNGLQWQTCFFLTTTKILFYLFSIFNNKKNAKLSYKYLKILNDSFLTINIFSFQ